MPDNDDNLFNDDGDDGAAGGDGAAGKPDPSTTPDPKSQKRIGDLQSLADKETARANQLQTRLDAIAAAQKEPNADGGKPADAGKAPDNSDVLDMARMFVFQMNPKLAEYGVEMSDITGTTPAEVAANATALVAKFEKIATKVRNKVLSDNGIVPEISSGQPDAKKRDFSNMPKEDFDKLVEASLRGQRP